jgi:hypothetical protein
MTLGVEVFSMGARNRKHDILEDQSIWTKIDPVSDCHGTTRLPKAERYWNIMMNTAL